MYVCVIACVFTCTGIRVWYMSTYMCLCVCVCACVLSCTLATVPTTHRQTRMRCMTDAQICVQVIMLKFACLSDAQNCVQVTSFLHACRSNQSQAAIALAKSYAADLLARLQCCCTRVNVQQPKVSFFNCSSIVHNHPEVLIPTCACRSDKSCSVHPGLQHFPHHCGALGVGLGLQ